MGTDGGTDRPTDQQTNRRSELQSHVAMTKNLNSKRAGHLEKNIEEKKNVIQKGWTSEKNHEREETLESTFFQRGQKTS